MSVFKLLIKKIVKDDEIYPRVGENQSTIESYAESLKAGAKFPPILVQKIVEDSKERTVFLDGVHRARAYERAGRKNVKAKYWKSKVLDKKRWLTKLRLEASRRNSIHGEGLRREDKKYQARRICESDPKVTEQEIADALWVPRETVRDWVKDIKLKQRAKQEATIYRLNALGWTQEEIAEAVGLTQRAVGMKIENLAKSPKLLKSLLKQGYSIGEAAEKLNLDLTLAWGMRLEGLDDLSRLELLSKEEDGLNCTPRPYDVWNFSSCNRLMGYGYDGRIPGQLVLQLLYFFAKKQGDLVVDPFAGSGTVADACLLMGRRCLAYDNKQESHEKRADIRGSDALEAIKQLKKKAKLIFLDPPYFKKKEREYGKESISSLPRAEYLDYFSSIAEECTKKLVIDGCVALLMSDYTEEDPSNSIFIWDYVKRFRNKGFEVERVILCPLTTQEIHGDFQLKFVRKRKLARLARYLVIFRGAK